MDMKKYEVGESILFDIGQKILEAHWQDLLANTSLRFEKVLDVVTVHQQKQGIQNVRPKNLAPKAQQAYFQTGAGQTQHLITDFFTDSTKIYQQLKALDSILVRNLGPEQIIWPFSNRPQDLLADEPSVPPNEAAQLGVRLVLSDELLTQLFTTETAKQYPSFAAFKNAIYLHLAQNIISNLDILVYFFGAAPIAMPEASGVKRSAIQAKRFLNCNMFQDFDSYLLSLRKAASEPQPKLLQAPLFLRPQKGDLDYRQGVQYLDLQVLDIQPNVADGVFDYQVQFLKLFLLFNVVHTTDPEKLTTAAQRFYQVANEDPTQPSQARPRVTAYLQEMREFATKFFPKTDYQTALDKMTQVVANETQAPTAQLALEFAQSGLFQFGQQLAAKNQRILTGEPYQLRGYTDKSLEIQQFIGSAIELGLNYRFLDGTGEFLQLRSQQQSAIINARITAKNPLILQAILADQQAMNNLLGFAQVAVPKGFVATDLTVAKSLFHAEFEKSGVVIAPQNGPKTAQQVFTTPIDEHTFTTSFLEALDYDDTVVVKAFIPGSVYDFYILDQRILAILEQVPVNVVGDGQSDIESLIDQKNDDDRRGRLGQRPLVTIPKTAATAAFLAQHQQNYQTIPDRGEQVFLSAIADLAAGGDSFDVYEEVDQSYQKLVLRIAQTLNMQQGHVAMIIPNIYAPYQPQPNSAIVTDVAAAVSIIPYSFPFAGNQRKLSQVIIQSLFSNSAKERADD
ncbi:hypothetical protein FC83_GL002552 [Agrilactobacillus composti DSM 18527 = JCM 14202]|uniref:Uncharacterized protein n=1 Tax=Agrilactobacillus composti DSM 18527 = JCM 14202 TaxID=1423734 RepID=A0A0R1Y4H9_9LACO|nr:hypothetical protein [Agrilactobacillus composti]KRM36677.1 hypothetical protein FC83_GL002552 [Agrilactobacillus composti DSM 18527 = JCM 14202]